MRPVDLDAIATVANQLDRLTVPYAFTGGAIIGFLLDNPNLLDVRPTKDVDAIVAVVTRAEYTDMEERLRRLGFRHDSSEGAPICRWLYQDITVDVMPTKDTTGHMSDRWFGYALQTAGVRSLGHVSIRTISPTCFIAVKLVAFENRANGDYLSHDIEDIVTVVDGRKTIAGEFEAEAIEIRGFVGVRIRDLLKQSRFTDSLPGHLGSDLASQNRFPLLLKRLHAIAQLAS